MSKENRFAGYFFDLDGTLVDSRLDFNKMREDLNFPEGVPILEEIEKLQTQQQKEKAFDIVHKHELEGANNSTLIAGVTELLKYLNENQIPTGILTRNSKECTEIMLKKHSLVFDHIITREKFRPKPYPDGLLHLAKLNSLKPEDCIYIGDFQLDIQTAKNAKMSSALILTGKNDHYKDQADIEISCYFEFLKTIS